MSTSIPGGSLTLAGDLTLSRMGFGAMQLAGPGVFGPPKDRAQAIAVLREAIALGVTHIDTADFYGPTTVNEFTFGVGRGGVTIAPEGNAMTRATTGITTPQLYPSADPSG